MIKLLKNTLMTMVLAGSMGAAMDASAISVSFFADGTNSGTNGGVITLAPGTTYTANVYGTNAELIYNVGALFQVTGAVTIARPPTLSNTAGPSCATDAPLFGSCQVNATGVDQYGTLAFQDAGLAAGTFRLATITINISGPGTLSFAGGTATDENFTDQTIAPASSVLVNVVPEPGTLFLLGTGLSGLVVVGRRRN